MVPDPSLVIGAAVAVVIGGVSIACGVVLPWRSVEAPERVARRNFERAMGLASLSAGATGLLMGLLEALALAYVDVTHDTGLLRRDGESLILIWVVIGWALAFVGSMWAIYREDPAGPATRPPIGQNLWFYGALLIVCALLARGSITADEAIGVVGGIPIGVIAFTSDLRWWIDHTVYRHRKASALALVVFGALFAARFAWFDVIAPR